MLMLPSKLSSLPSLTLEGTEGGLGASDEGTAVTGDGSGL